MPNISKISLAKFNGEVIRLIKLDGIIIWQQGDFFISKTDYSVVKGSVITIEYVTDMDEQYIEVQYDSTKFSKNGNEYTVLADGLNEITFFVNDKAHTVVRVATAVEEGGSTIVNIDKCVFDADFQPLDNMTVYSDLGGGNFMLDYYSDIGYGLVNYPRSQALICFEFDFNDITSSVNMDVAFNLSCLEYDEYGDDSGDYACFDLRNQPIADPVNLRFGTTYQGNEYKTAEGHYVREITEPGTYYLYIKYRDYPNGNDYSGEALGQLCVKSISVSSSSSIPGIITYPATRISVSSDDVDVKTNDSFEIAYSVVPDNYNEEIKIEYDSTYLRKEGNKYTARKEGNTKIVYRGMYAITEVNVDVYVNAITSIIVDETKSIAVDYFDRDFKIDVTVNPSDHSDEVLVEYDSSYLSYNASYDVFTVKREIGQYVETDVTFRSKSNRNIYKTVKVIIIDKDVPYFEYILDGNVGGYLTDSVSSNQKRGIPVIYSRDNTVISYDDIKIRMKNGSTLVDPQNIACKDVESIIVWPNKSYSYFISMPAGIKTLVGGKLTSYMTINYVGLFNECTYLTDLLDDASRLITSNVTQLTKAFRNCLSLKELDLSEWNTSKVTVFDSMFYRCIKLSKLKLSKWDTSSAVNFISMFEECRELKELDLSGWNTSKVTDFSSMFKGCTSLEKLYIDGWTVQKSDMMNYINTSYMFEGCTSLKEIHCSKAAIEEIYGKLPDRYGKEAGKVVTTETLKDWTVSYLQSINWLVEYK